MAILSQKKQLNMNIVLESIENCQAIPGHELIGVDEQEVFDKLQTYLRNNNLLNIKNNDLRQIVVDLMAAQRVEFGYNRETGIHSLIALAPPPPKIETDCIN